MCVFAIRALNSKREFEDVVVGDDTVPGLPGRAIRGYFISNIWGSRGCGGGRLSDGPPIEQDAGKLAPRPPSVHVLAEFLAKSAEMQLRRLHHSHLVLINPIYVVLFRPSGD